jgi:hypothetical protein
VLALKASTANVALLANLVLVNDANRHKFNTVHPELTPSMSAPKCDGVSCTRILLHFHKRNRLLRTVNVRNKFRNDELPLRLRRF